MKLKGRVGKRKGVGERGRGGNYVNIALMNVIHKKILKVDFFFLLLLCSPHWPHIYDNPPTSSF